ncbi:MAG: hypothetical protein ACTJHC_02560 [Vagococcus sp.]
MVRKKLSIIDITNQLLASRLYVEEGTLIVIYNKTQRVAHPDVDFFELVYSGDDLYLNLSIIGTDRSYDEHINLTTVNNINGIEINPAI